MGGSDLQKFARAWLLKNGWFSKQTDYDGRLGKAVMELVKTVEDQRHSGWSFGRTIQIFNLMILAYNQDVAARLRAKGPIPGNP